MGSDRPTDRPQLSAEQQPIFELLSQKTCHLIVQFVLGHPEHLMSMTELNYALPKNQAAISDQLDRLVEAEILDQYSYEPSETEPNLPSEFYGLTKRGVEILYKYNYLRGVPVLRAFYKNPRKSAQIERHENAPRPELPEAIREALSTE